MANEFYKWMTGMPALDGLTVGELVLPGAHNSGVDKKASYAVPGVSHWAACQNNSFYYQLVNGARALDLRLEYDGKGGFWFQHNGYRSSRALEDLIMAVDRFLEQNPAEFIVLNFQQLSSDSSPFDVKEFSRLLTQHLGGRVIPPENRYLTLGELKRTSPFQRVMLASYGDVDRSYFNWGLRGEWTGIDFASVADVKVFITKTIAYPNGVGIPWSLSATSYGLAQGPVNITTHLNEWFDPARNERVLNCSVINVDFFEESALVAHCMKANLMKAKAKQK
ncbi:phospholipase [Pseudomonas sp. FW306-02-F02-AA]|uniref:Phospholipase n=1 Tax=Pseudomonas fluorescens TaxID=294 RepID=A0A0N9VTP2_PSEFL|nr:MULTISPECIES: hypothetical protein [Pseudomonas]ALI03961.1 phospholipase [Pseudomonas fluorescens]PMZ04888.1 phospholipase [Pseudomonas sp. FW306-02-F02-AB]PMZ12053.1 phospholipase [Pseudomonas sp. FW306-02-H06C]PMZ17813.1 phospholipase [Pseudomonas sp. FW306-02-F02-AA]PMZ23845.1 phospholipase [Pseudomonas sp. FW306-02-F08-AA]